MLSTAAASHWARDPLASPSLACALLSNYFVFGHNSRLAPAWHMTEGTVRAGVVLDFNSTRYCVDTILGIEVRNLPLQDEPKVTGPGIPSLMQRLFGTTDQLEAYRNFGEQWRALSRDRHIRHAASKITLDGTARGEPCEPDGDEGLVVRGTRSKGCQNWFMELDVVHGPIWRWASDRAAWQRAGAGGVLAQIEQWLPTERAPR